ncbi:hypothetical protein CPB86DRAFT_825779 [Serendipita vermifera]|nr:hypothetical protein CPB86DRAFT_825779 [Serendipita vermifera]
MRSVIQAFYAMLLFRLALCSTVIKRQNDAPAPQVTNFYVSSTRSIYISWNPLLPAPEGLELSGIVVYVKEAGGQVYTGPFPPNSIDGPMSGLKPDTSQEVWVCAVYDSGVGEKCSDHIPFTTPPENGPPPSEGTWPKPSIDTLVVNGPNSIRLHIQGGSSDYSYYAVVIKSDSGYESNTSFDNHDKVDNMWVDINDLPPGTKFTIWLEGCKSFIFNFCSGAGPQRTFQTPCIDHACAWGYVWREATSNDFVCVTPEVRSNTRRDNELANDRKNPDSDICKQGFVWREVTPEDHVCVTPETRDLTRQLNDSAHERVAPNCA